MKYVPSQHYRDNSGKIRNYNGMGRWSVEEIQQRYLENCKNLDLANPQIPQPMKHSEGDILWIYPVMLAVNEGIKNGDKACVLIGIELIEEEEHLPFGRNLKAHTARYLRRSELTPGQILRLRKRIIDLLLAGKISYEFRDYAKLLRKIGIGDRRSEIEHNLETANRYVRRWSDYLLSK